jgi:hypothetical protein
MQLGTTSAVARERDVVPGRILFSSLLRQIEDGSAQLYPSATKRFHFGCQSTLNEDTAGSGNPRHRCSPTCLSFVFGGNEMRWVRPGPIILKCQFMREFVQPNAQRNVVAGEAAMVV